MVKFVLVLNMDGDITRYVKIGTTVWLVFVVFITFNCITFSILFLKIENRISHYRRRLRRRRRRRLEC